MRCISFKPVRCIGSEKMFSIQRVTPSNSCTPHTSRPQLHARAPRSSTCLATSTLPLLRTQTPPLFRTPTSPTLWTHRLPLLVTRTSPLLVDPDAATPPDPHTNTVTHRVPPDVHIGTPPDPHTRALLPNPHTRPTHTHERSFPTHAPDPHTIIPPIPRTASALTHGHSFNPTHTSDRSRPLLSTHTLLYVSVTSGCTGIVSDVQIAKTFYLNFSSSIHIQVFAPKRGSHLRPAIS